MLLNLLKLGIAGHGRALVLLDHGVDGFLSLVEGGHALVLELLHDVIAIGSLKWLGNLAVVEGKSRFLKLRHHAVDAKPRQLAAVFGRAAVLRQCSGRFLKIGAILEGGVD